MCLLHFFFCAFSLLPVRRCLPDLWYRQRVDLYQLTLHHHRLGAAQVSTSTDKDVRERVAMEERL